MADRDAEVQSLIRTVAIPSIQKTTLQSICAVQGIPKTGNKADLQKRIVDRIKQLADSKHWERLEEMKKTISSYTGINFPPRVAPQPAATYSQAQQQIPDNIYAPRPYAGMGSFATTGFGAVQGMGLPNFHSALNGSSRAVPPPPQTFNFKPSPFYEMKHQIGRIRTLETHRNTERFDLRAVDDAALQMCVSDPAMRVMVFCAGASGPDQDIAFPHQCELKVNGGDIKANLRGLKNKPGSTRPVDITDSLRLKPANYKNNIELTYALTQKQFYVSIIVCKMVPVETLVSQITKKIRKESVIAEITRRNNDDEIEATSQNLSLKCPLSYMRLQRPCRAVSCNHIQCFDATSYLQLQEQGPQWICPICNNPAPFNQLAIDEYAMDILSRTDDSVEQVTIDTNAEWSVPGAKKEFVAPVKTEGHSFVLDDDLVISEVAPRGERSTLTPSMTSVSTSATYIGTPASGISRDASAAPRSSSKRPAPDVIDLTLSDDEDDTLARPAKRVNYGDGTANATSYSRQGMYRNYSDVAGNSYYERMQREDAEAKNARK